MIQEQINYYRARANEYDEWFYRTGRYERGEELKQQWFKEVDIVKKSLYQVGLVESVLELACGTGIWTQELLNIGQKILAIDAAKEMISINQAKLNSHQIEYRQLDLFTWQPEAEYDLVFFSFWLSHVPPNLLNQFLQKVYQSVRIGGQVFMVDSRFEPTSTAKDHILENDGNIYKVRKLNNGQEFTIVKVFYQPDELQEYLQEPGFNAQVNVTDNYFIRSVESCNKLYNFSCFTQPKLLVY